MASKNHTYFFVTVLSAILALHVLPCYGTGQETLYDPDGYQYDIHTGSGTCIEAGTDDAYDSAYLLRINGVTYNTNDLMLSGRHIIGGTEILSGLQVSRKIYVPASKIGSLGNFGRWYDSLHNPSGSPIIVSVEYSSNLGSDSSTVVSGTDDGDTVIETSDQWIATDDSWDGTEDPSLAHIMYVKGAPEPIDYVALEGAGYANDRPVWRYDNVVVNPGQTIAFLTFAVQERNRASSFDEANGIISSLASANLSSVALQELSVDEYLSLVNLSPVPPDDLQITPLESFVSAGNEGGPFDPVSTVFTLYNAGSTAFDWSVEPDVPWLDVVANTGNLPGQTNTPVTISINANANILPQGEHVGPVSFTNLTSGVVQKRYVRLMIGIRRVLVYTQYADTSIGGEYDNTMKAVDSTGTYFSVSIMTDSNQLSSMLPMHQVLLIPEQENATLAQLFVIGTEWAPILQDFVNGGGAIIQCDYAQRYGILTGSGLMNITTSSNFSNVNVDVVAPDDPIAGEVDSPYTASRYSSYYYTNEGQAVVERPGYGPVVIHKMIGRGHVVLIGHDYYESNSEQDKIVGNAVLNLPFLKDDLWVWPLRGLDFSGNRGGPFTPTSESYTVTNVGDSPIEWTAAKAEPWLSVEPNSGTLDPYGSGGDSRVVVVSITANAEILPAGDYNDIITFTDVNSGYNEIRVVRLQTAPIPQEIKVYDTIAPIDDLYIPFGDVIVRQSSAEEIMIKNTSPDCNLAIYEISTPPVLSTGFFDDFPNTILDLRNWTGTVGAPTIDSIGLNEPSPPYSLRLNGHPSGEDAVESSVIDLSGLSQVELRYWWQRTGGGDAPEANDDLIIEYWSGTDWVELERQLGDGPAMSGYAESIVVLPSEACHENFSLRIRSIGSANPEKVYDDWFVDDVSISVPVFRLEGIPELPASIPPLGDLTFSVMSAPTEISEYESEVIIRSNDEDEPQIEILLECSGIPDWLAIVPKEDFEFSGHPGGPFLPSNKPYSLTNTGSSSISWAVELIDVPWLDAEPTSGSIKPGKSTTVVVSPTSQANTMPAGKHIGRLIFTDETTAAVHKRTVILNVQTEPKIRVTPKSLDLTIPCGQLQIETLSIGNTGDADLEFNLRSHEISFTPAPKNNRGTNTSEETNDVNAAGDQIERKTAVRLDVPYAEGELFVRFAPEIQVSGDKPGIMETSRKEMLLSGVDATVAQEYSIVPGLCLVSLPEGMTVEDALTAFGDSNDVLYAVPNYKVQAHSLIPNDPMFSVLWNLHNTGETGGTLDADIDAPETWEIATGGGADEDILVAVIDTGVDYRHPDLAANMWGNEAEFNGSPGFDDDRNGYVDDIYGYDFCNYDGDPIDDHGHGSHVSGIIGAVGNNSVGVVGVCWNVKIMAVKFLDASGSGWTSDAIASVQYAILMGAKVMNNSWGGGAYDMALEDTIRAAGNAGMLFVASAGNDYGSNNDADPQYPSGYDLPNVIAVLSTDDDDQLSNHSNYGPTFVDIGAPGGDPDCEIYSCYRNGGYYYAYGTSMAAPHVSGACALIWSVSPSLPHTEVKDIIMRTADPLASLAGRCVSGGRLNLHSAILETEVAWIDFSRDSGSVSAGEVNDVDLIFDANQPVGTYKGQIVVYSSDEYTPQVIVSVTMTVEQVDYFTELFDFKYPFDPNDPNCNDTANRMLTLTPNGSGSYYRACYSEAAGFPVDPADGAYISLRDDDYAQINLGGECVDFYGIGYDTLYIGSNGYVTFLSGDTHYIESLANHFDLPRISALFDDLDPSTGGAISWKQLSDRIAVTFENVREHGSAENNSFQIEMFYNGRIRLTWLDIAAADGLVGLSQGNGVPLYYVESDMTEYGSADDLDNDCDTDFGDYSILALYWQAKDCDPDNDWCGGTDVNNDGKVDFSDLAELLIDWLPCN